MKWEIFKFRKGFILAVSVLIMGLIFLGCRQSDDDSADPPGCYGPTYLNDNTFCMIVNGTKIEGSSTTNATIPFLNADPFVHYYYDSGNADYNVTFVSTYSSGSTDYPGTNFDGFGILFRMTLKGTLAVGDLSLTSSPYVDNVTYSPTGTSDLYYAKASHTGSSAFVILNRLANDPGDFFHGTLGSITLCRVNSSYVLADACATSVTISSGSFNIVRDWDDAL